MISSFFPLIYSFLFSVQLPHYTIPTSFTLSPLFLFYVAITVVSFLLLSSKTSSRDFSTSMGIEWKQRLPTATAFICISKIQINVILLWLHHHFKIKIQILGLLRTHTKEISFINYLITLYQTTKIVNLF